MPWSVSQSISGRLYALAAKKDRQLFLTFRPPLSWMSESIISVEFDTLTLLCLVWNELTSQCGHRLTFGRYWRDIKEFYSAIAIWSVITVTFRCKRPINRSLSPMVSDYHRFGCIATFSLFRHRTCANRAQMLNSNVCLESECCYPHNWFNFSLNDFTYIAHHCNSLSHH